MEETMNGGRPLSVDQIAELIADGTSFDARRARVTRAINDGALGGAFKVNPSKQTSPWLVPADEAAKWLKPKPEKGDAEV